MISIDLTVFIHIVNMIVLMIILNKVLYKPVLEFMDKRQENKAVLSSAIEKFEQNAQARQAEADHKMREAGMRARKALEAARAEAEAAGAEKVAAVRRQAEQDKERQLAEIHAQFDAARSELLDNAAGFAQEMAVKILGRSVQA
jgi:F-type H+-transporting ATPase subunit b